VPKDTHPTQPTNTDLALPEQVTIALGKLAGAARDGLLALAVGTGIQVLHALLAVDVDRLVGPRGRHNPDRAAVRHGTQPGQVTLGGRRVRVDRPRVRTADSAGEVPCRPGRRLPAPTCWTGDGALQELPGSRIPHTADEVLHVPVGFPGPDRLDRDQPLVQGVFVPIGVHGVKVGLRLAGSRI
jgi:hypothetical protein